MNFTVIDFEIANLIFEKKLRKMRISNTEIITLKMLIKDIQFQNGILSKITEKG